MLAEKEAIIIEKLKSDRSFVREEIIIDYKIIHELALLQRGLEITPQVLMSQYGNAPSLPKFRPTITIDEVSGNFVAEFKNLGEMRMPLSTDFSLFFTSFLSFTNQLCLSILFTLRLELRTHCFYYVDLALRESNYILEDPVFEPDNYVSLLFRDLISLELIMEDWLPEEKQR